MANCSSSSDGECHFKSRLSISPGFAHSWKYHNQINKFMHIFEKKQSAINA